MPAGLADTSSAIEKNLAITEIARDMLKGAVDFGVGL
jgi:hypothetical protein